MNLRELILDYNVSPSPKPMYPNISAIFSNLRTLSFSHIDWCMDEFNNAFCFDRNYLLDVDNYFPVRPPVLQMTTSLITNDTSLCTEEPLSFSKTFQFPASLEFVHMVDFGLSSPMEMKCTACINDLHIRYLNISMNKSTKVLCNDCHLDGVSRLDIADASYGALELITPEFMQYVINLRFLNLSHDALGVSGFDFQGTFSQLPLLEYINLSYNKLGQISPRAFQHCTRLRRLNFAKNELTQIDIYMDHCSTPI